MLKSKLNNNYFIVVNDNIVDVKRTERSAKKMYKYWVAITGNKHKVVMELVRQIGTATYTGTITGKEYRLAQAYGIFDSRVYIAESIKKLAYEANKYIEFEYYHSIEGKCYIKVIVDMIGHEYYLRLASDKSLVYDRRFNKCKYRFV